MWVVNSHLKQVGWFPESFWTGAENLGRRTQHRPAPSESQFRPPRLGAAVRHFVNNTVPYTEVVFHTQTSGGNLNDFRSLLGTRKDTDNWLCAWWCAVYSCTINLSPFNPVSFTKTQPPFNSEHATISVLLVACDKWASAGPPQLQCNKWLRSFTGVIVWLHYTQWSKCLASRINRFRLNLVCVIQLSNRVTVEVYVFNILNWSKFIIRA
jgi:hypothetical protein